MRPCNFALPLIIGFGAVGDAEGMDVYDSRLELTLFAETPDIVTPIGIAVDARDRLFVVESHTHHPPEDYSGPESDRILVFEDTDGDGRADRRSVYAEGLSQAMGMAIAPNGVPYVVMARSVVALPDRDGDGVCDGVERVAVLETNETYAHNCLMGLTFDAAGMGYVTRGNVGSRAWRFVGSDGSFVGGYGDGGNVMRFGIDGGSVREVATGFWNPFCVALDVHGRLLVTDNDPDSRGPNRLVQVVDGGDYGYRSVFGGAGTHPFQGWEGDLPGTLGFVAPMGEAPCDWMDAARLSFPDEYRDSMLGAIWNENSIERYRMDREAFGLQLKTRSVLVRGDESFRPVGMAADRAGNLYITDWARVDYPNHGLGRVWKLSHAGQSSPLEEAGVIKARLSAEIVETDAGVRDALASNDALVRWAGVRALSSERFLSLRRLALGATDFETRLGALIASRESGDDGIAVALEALEDSNPEIRRFAIRWIAEHGDLELRGKLRRALEVGETTKEVFGAYLGALGILTEAFVPGYRDRVWERANQAPRGVDAEVLASLARDGRLATSVRAMALREMGASEVSDLAEEMLRWMVSDDSEMRWEAMWRVSELPGEVVAAQLWSVATSESLGPETRADALFFAATRSEFDSSGEKIATLLRDPSEAVAIEAARALRDRTVSDDARGRVAAIRVATRGEDLAPALAEALELVSHAEDDAAARARPKSDAEWLESARAGGDPRRGRRVFWSRRAQCSNCHGMHSRDTRLGPDLAGVGASMDQERIARSILQPSAEFSPQFQAWMVRLKSGDTVVGLQLDHKARGAIELFTTDKRTRRFEGEEIESYAVLPFSLMPEGLEMLMTESEFRDLVAYLAEPNL